MKRKIIGQGSGFTCTLPINWIRTHNLQAGYELEIEESEGKLVISAEKKKIVERAQFDASSVSRALERCILAFYRKATDEVEILYEKGEAVQRVQQLLERELIGYEIVEHSGTRCVVKDVTGAEAAVFGVLLRRCFLLLDEYARQCCEALHSGSKEALAECERCHRAIAKLANHCQRLTLKEAHTNPREAVFLFHLLRELKQIASEYARIVHYYERKERVGARSMALLEQLAALVGRMHTAFYAFELQEADEIDAAVHEFEKSAASCTEYVVLFHYCVSIAQHLQVMLDDYFCLKL